MSEKMTEHCLLREMQGRMSIGARNVVLALITERDQLEERMAAMEGALRKIGSMLSVAHDFDCFDDKCEGNCGDPEKMCDSCRMADACIDAGYTIIAALDAPIEDSLRADLAAAKDEAEDIATLLRVSDSLLAAENALYAALEGVVGEMIFHSSRKDGECL